MHDAIEHAFAYPGDVGVLHTLSASGARLSAEGKWATVADCATPVSLRTMSRRLRSLRANRTITGAT